MGYATNGLAESQGETPDSDDTCRLCGEPTSTRLPFPLCARCALDVWRFVNHATALGDKLTLPDEDREPLWRAAIDRQRERQQRSLVYYVRRTDLIKIGTTINFAVRMSEIRPDEVLAVEPGGYQLEQRRHAEFASLRVGRREWFRDDPTLRTHITALIETHGAPPTVPIF